MRVACVEDAEGLEIAMSIRRRVFVDEIGIDARLEQDGNPPGARVFLAWTDAGAAVATGRYVRKGDAAKFERIATLKAHRGAGLGRVLMESMQRDARERHPEARLVLNAQADAIPFYLKLGWRIVGDRFVEAGIEHARMELVST